jgi:putative two-component system response regulator
MHQLTESAASRLLIVDDEPSIRKFVSLRVRNAGYACEEAESAADGWMKMQQSGFDLVMVDVLMPGGSGLDLLKRITQSYPDVAVLMMTGDRETTTAIKALTQGAYGYLLKPFASEELVVQVAKALEKRRLVIENRIYTTSLEQKVNEQTKAIHAAHEETIHRLVCASVCRDEETGAHIQRVGWCSELLAAGAGWSPTMCERIRLAAPMHDLGKLGIPDAILSKPGKLTQQEMAVMKTHTTLGAAMLAGSASPVLQMAEEIALGHHERWDGSGYPRGLCGEDIPEAARIVAIVDVYDALSQDRVYRPALSEAEVTRILEAGCDVHFDRRLLGVFLSQLPEVRAIAEAVVDDVVSELNRGSEGRADSVYATVDTWPATGR